MGIIKSALEMQKRIDAKIQSGERLTKSEAIVCIENILDSLTEVGNGITDEELSKNRDQMFAFRDQFLKPFIQEFENTEEYFNMTFWKEEEEL